MTSNRNISSLMKQSLIVNSNKMKWIKSKSKTMDTKKSNSCWWSSLISLKNSKWLQDNLEEMDQKLKLMLKLIEEDADSFAKRAEMYYQKRPELITLVEDFNRMYHELAERYDAITGELRKNHVLPYDYLQSNGSETSDVGLPPPNSPSPEEQDWLRRRITDLETELSHVKENENSISMLGAQIQQLKAEICKKNDDVGELNKMVEDLKVNCDELRSEKESLDAKISTLFAEMGSKDEMVDHLNERVKELEMEVERKEEVIKQGAEEKREAIRQLCFSIEHYRNGYHRSR